MLRLIYAQRAVAATATVAVAVVRAPQFIGAGAQVSRDGDHKSPRSNMAYTQRTQTQRITTTARYAGQLCQHMTPC